MKDNKIPFKNILLMIIFFSLWNTSISAYDPSSYFDDATSVYVEVYPAEDSINKIKKLFNSLMNKEKAETEWRSFEDYFSEDIGFNILSLENLHSAAFDTSSPAGIGINYMFEKANSDKTIKYVTVLLPTTQATKSFQFLKNALLNRIKQNQVPSKTPLLVEIEKDSLVRIFDPSIDAMPVFIYKSDHFIIVSENPATIKSYSKPSSNPLNKNNNFITRKKLYEKKVKKSDIIGFYFINQKVFDRRIRVRPRLLFDNILMDNSYVKEFSANSDSICGILTINDHEVKVIADYIFPLNYLLKNNSFLANIFNFKNKSYFPDNITALPMAFVKWQTNFSSDHYNETGENTIDEKIINNFVTRITGGLDVAIPEKIILLFKENISIYIQDVPNFKDINNYYLWKGYLSMNYNPQYYGKFLKYMENIIASSKNSKKTSVVYSKSGEISQWELNITHFIKKYDKIKEQVVLDEKIIKTYIFSDSSQIIITHDPTLLKKKPAQSISPIYSRLLPDNTKGKHMLFSYIDIKMFLAYLKKTSLAFSNNYLSYLENLNSVFFTVNQENDTITEELIIKLDK
ncbi:MAG: hypothetical protein OEV78_06240 [Spirochaetia bacterium]|nr:hypothetical protein [Spirochaetia bacterium]